jgi:hypothetical protein
MIANLANHKIVGGKRNTSCKLILLQKISRYSHILIVQSLSILDGFESNCRSCRVLKNIFKSPGRTSDLGTTYV